MITFTSSNGTITVVPSAMKWSLQDISSADSGRDYTGLMWKNRIGQKRKLELTFTGYSHAKTAQLMQVVNAEYFDVTYPDMLSGVVETRTFYAGDRETEVFVWWDGNKVNSSVTFNVIER